jgi:hypothetical protein
VTPSVGRIVHYVSYGTPAGEYASECRAAIITEVTDGTTTVGLCVLNPTGQFFNRAVEQHEPVTEGGVTEIVGGTWHWPERV